MSVKYLSQVEADTVTEMPAKILFDFTNKDSVPEGKDPGDCIVIRPLTVRTWFKIRPLLLSIEKDDLDKMVCKPGEVNESLQEIMDKYSELLLDIVCLGIHNRKSNPPAWFREVLIDNCTWEDIRILLNAVIYRIGYFPFCKSITILKSVSPLEETEIIAAQKNLKSWQLLAKEDTLLV